MPDCSRAQIPDELIAAKGHFKCAADFAPVPDINGVVPDLEGFINGSWVDNPNYSCGIGALGALLTGGFPLTNSSYSEEISVWQSEVFNIPPATPRPSNMVNQGYISPLCVNYYGNQDGLPAICYANVVKEQNMYPDQSFNVGIFGSSIQYFFYLYKIYCCVYDQKGNVIDFDYFFYYSITQNSSKYGFRVLDYGDISFCTEGVNISASNMPQIGVRQ